MANVEEKEFRVDRVISGGNPNNYYTHISGGRLGMSTSIIGQWLPLRDAQTKQLLSGNEQSLARSTWDIRLESDEDVMILDIIDKFRPDGERIFHSKEKTIIYRMLESNRIGAVTIPEVMKHHVTFGFTLVPRVDVRVGDVLPANAILATGPSRRLDDNFAFGRECNTAAIGTFGTNEDGAEAAMSVKTMFQSEIITETEVMVESNSVLLNLYGNDEYYKPLPSIGDVLDAKGLIVAKRELRNDFKLLNTSKYALQHVQRPFDTEVYGPPKAEVIDIVVKRGRKAKTDNMPAGMVTYLDALANNHRQYYDRITELDRMYKRVANSAAPGSYTRHPSWHILVTNAHQNVGTRVSNKPEPNTTMMDTVISGYQIIIKTRKINTPRLGHKFSGLSAEKYVICNFREDRDMATDKWGRHALFHVNPIGISNRNNPSQLFETFTTDACFHTQRVLKGMQSNNVSTSEMWEYLETFYKLISPTSHNLVKDLDPSQKVEHLNYVIEHRIDLRDTIGDEHLGYGLMHNLKDTPYWPERDVVRLGKGDGTFELTKNKVRVSNKYVIALEKIGSTSSACSIPLRQSEGFAAKHSSRLKKGSPMSTQAARCYGESEFRDIIAKAGSKVAKLIMNLNSNPQASKHMADKMLAKLGFIDMSDTTQFVGRGLAMLKHLLESFGFTIGKKDDKRKR